MEGNSRMTKIEHVKRIFFFFQSFIMNKKDKDGLENYVYFI